jgi:hypothetical protein
LDPRERREEDHRQLALEQTRGFYSGRAFQFGRPGTSRVMFALGLATIALVVIVNVVARVFR